MKGCALDTCWMDKKKNLFTFDEEEEKVIFESVTKYCRNHLLFDIFKLRQNIGSQQIYCLLLNMKIHWRILSHCKMRHDLRQKILGPNFKRAWKTVLLSKYVKYLEDDKNNIVPLEESESNNIDLSKTYEEAAFVKSPSVGYHLKSINNNQILSNKTNKEPVFVVSDSDDNTSSSQAPSENADPPEACLSKILFSKPRTTTQAAKVYGLNTPKRGVKLKSLLIVDRLLSILMHLCHKNKIKYDSELNWDEIYRLFDAPFQSVPLSTLKIRYFKIRYRFVPHYKHILFPEILRTLKSLYLEPHKEFLTKMSQDAIFDILRIPHDSPYLHFSRPFKKKRDSNTTSSEESNGNIPTIDFDWDENVITLD